MNTQLTETTEAGAERKETTYIFPFPSILPVNTLEEIRQNCGFGEIDPAIISGLTPFRRSKTQEVKDLYVVLFGPVARLAERIELLRSREMQLCTDGLNFFFGLLGKTLESEMPPELLGKDIVVADPAAIFTDAKGRHCYAYANRNGGCRDLGLVPADADRQCCVFEALLAERLPPKTPPP